jgi:hypothetical protein
MKHAVASKYSERRYINCVDGAILDLIKSDHAGWLNESWQSIAKALTLMCDQGEIKETTREKLARIVKNHLNWFDGIETENRETAFMKTAGLPTLEPHERVLEVRKSTDAEGFQPVRLRAGPKMLAYDIPIMKSYARLMEHNTEARRQIYESIVEFSSLPPEHCKGGKVVITDIIDAKAVTEHAVLGLHMRVTREEAELTSADRPLHLAAMIWSDGFRVSYTLSQHSRNTHA